MKEVNEESVPIEDSIHLSEDEAVVFAEFIRDMRNLRDAWNIGYEKYKLKHASNALKNSNFNGLTEIPVMRNGKFFYNYEHLGQLITLFKNLIDYNKDNTLIDEKKKQLSIEILKKIESRQGVL